VFSIVIPAHNEEETVGATVQELAERLYAEGILFDVVVVDDHSTDGTVEAVARVARSWPEVRCVTNRRVGGFGNAVNTGLEEASGDAIAIVMADASDVVAYWRKLEEGYDCVFGSRFMRGAKIVDYPWFKLVLNRGANAFVALLFGVRYYDMTNAFKCYRREVIEGVRPILSHHFNITVELPLKAIVRGYSWTVIPTSWYNRKGGVSKFKIKEMGSRYLFIVLYAMIEKLLSRGDYRVHRAPASPNAEQLPVRR